MKNRAVSFFTSGSLGSFGRAHRLLVSTVIGSAVLFLGAVAFAAIVSGTSTTNISAHVTYTQLTINKPTVSVGDVMVASMAVLDGSIGNVTAPTGWTQIARTDNDVNVTLISYWKVASASEPSTYTWTIDEQTKAVGGITPYTGVDTTNPIDAVAGNTGFGTTATTSAITASSPNAEVVALFATDVSKTFSTPTGMTEKYDLSHTGAGPSTAADDAIQASAGTITSKSSTITGNKARNWSSQLIALRAVPPVPTPVAYWKLDGNSNDAVGSNNGSDANITYSTTDGKINQGTGLDGSSSKIDIGHMLTGAVNVSMAAWIKTTSDGFIVSQRQGPNPMPGQADFFITGGKVTFFEEGGGNTNNVAQGNTTVTDGNWHYVGVSQSGNTYTFYLDGVADGSVTSGTPVTFDTNRGGAIGYDRLTNSNYFNGSIDEVSVWDTSLSASAFATLYNGGAGDQYPF